MCAFGVPYYTNVVTFQPIATAICQKIVVCASFWTFTEFYAPMNISLYSYRCGLTYKSFQRWNSRVSVVEPLQPCQRTLERFPLAVAFGVPYIRPLFPFATAKLGIIFYIIL